ncbi:zinc alcohol [Lasallia pustulata]|uniref:Zinc alcohol n=1 Tax=Lasallia pustulata TaxID=136370 RepID=A0A1W5D5T6_9LECA|nr:zinc alcohol [Lasallia pustulata]
MQRIGKWMQEGKVKSIIDEKFKFEDAPAAFKKLKTGRARGKIVSYEKAALRGGRAITYNKQKLERKGSFSLGKATELASPFENWFKTVPQS